MAEWRVGGDALLLALHCWWTYASLRRAKQARTARLRRVQAGGLRFAAFQAWQQLLSGGGGRPRSLMEVAAASAGRRVWRRRVYAILEPEMGMVVVARNQSLKPLL